MILVLYSFPFVPAIAADSCVNKAYQKGAGDHFVLKAGPYHPHRKGMGYSTPKDFNARTLWKTEMKFSGRNIEVYVECKGLKPKRDRRSRELRVEATAGKGCVVFAPKKASDLPLITRDSKGCSLSTKEVQTALKAVKEDREKYWIPFFSRKKGKKIAAKPDAAASADAAGADAGLAEKIEICTPDADSSLYQVNLKTAVGGQCKFNPAEVGSKTLCAMPASCKRADDPSYLTTIMCLSNDKGECPDFATCLVANDLDVDPRVAMSGSAEVEKPKATEPAATPAATTEKPGDESDD